MQDGSARIGQILDELGRSGRTAILISFVMPDSGRISGNVLSRADIQSMRTDDLSDQKTFYRILKAIGEIGEAGLSGAPRIPSGKSAPYEFKGDSLGMPLPEFKQRHYRAVKTGVTAPFCSSEGPTNEPWHRNASVVHCMLDSPLEDVERSVGGAPVNTLLYEFVDEQLFRISMTFGKDDYHRVERALRSKLGPPVRSDKRPTQSVWANGISSVHLMLGIGPKDSGLVFVHDELFSLVNERASFGDLDL